MILTRQLVFKGYQLIASKITAPAIAGSLNHLFNLSFARGEIPQEWKTAKVTPIFKVGSKMNIENYRPISVLPLVVKVFERLVYRQLYSFLLTGSQSGFRPRHSAQDSKWLMTGEDTWIIMKLWVRYSLLL